MKRIMRILVFALTLAGLVGCDKKEEPVVRIGYQPEIRYQIVEIEGRRWIATPGSHGEWSLAGPLE
jgi:hypothetical protein